MGLRLSSLGAWIDATESMLINRNSCNSKGACAGGAGLFSRMGWVGWDMPAHPWASKEACHLPHCMPTAAVCSNPRRVPGAVSQEVGMCGLDAWNRRRLGLHLGAGNLPQQGEALFVFPERPLGKALPLHAQLLAAHHPNHGATLCCWHAMVANAAGAAHTRHATRCVDRMYHQNLMRPCGPTHTISALLQPLKGCKRGYCLLFSAFYAVNEWQATDETGHPGGGRYKLTGRPGHVGEVTNLQGRWDDVHELATIKTGPHLQPHAL